MMLVRTVRFRRQALVQRRVAVVQRLVSTRPKPATPSGGDKYERKTPHEHVLLRPGMYIGQTEASTIDTWVFNDSTKKMEKRRMHYSPALLKIFDEILVNASDNYQRDSSMTAIDITIEINAKSNKLVISVRNDGKGIPIEKHAKEDMYLPELVFGNLLTGSNFNDSDNSLTGGRHGYGAKLTNIFSRSFEIETLDPRVGLRYSQKWSRNMFECSPPVLEPVSVEKGTSVREKKATSYTKITFEPDLPKFAGAAAAGAKDGAASVVSFLQDTVLMMKRRVLDVAGCLGRGASVAVSLNGRPVPIHSFEDYSQLFSPDGAPPPASSDGAVPDAGEASGAKIFHTKVGGRWDLSVLPSPTGNFEHLSFVNGCWTFRGGSHLAIVLNQLVAAIDNEVAKHKLAASQALIRSKLMLVLRAEVPSPSFDSQSKDSLSTSASTIQASMGGAPLTLPPSFIKRVLAQSGIIEEIIQDLEQKEHGRLQKISSKSSAKVIVPKLEDAHLAGTQRSAECSLILTEGDSAKALAVAGLEVLGRQTYGVLPLRGKILNVRGATSRQLAENHEFTMLIRALGLTFDREYSAEGGPSALANQGLRYGKILIMTDQDQDGAHIKGLLLNLFHRFWPSLLQVEGFFQQFVTPLVKVKDLRAQAPPKDAKSSKDKGSAAAALVKAGGPRDFSVNTLNFYSLAEYDQWLHTLSDKEREGNRYATKYYKGLGTNTAAEGRVYFTALESHQKFFTSPDAASTAEAIDLAFSSDRARDRRDWLLTKYNPNAFTPPQQRHVSVKEFVDTDLIQFSFADNARSIPSVVDGLKPAQRKILFGCFKRGLDKEEVKVVQLAGFIAEHTAYHHGESSLHSAIVHLAQDFVGSNNLPLLNAGGQFGTRAQGGADSASPRYIFTSLSPVTRLLYPEADDAQLQEQVEEGQRVEPLTYVPVVSVLAINGATGIGTGWSTSVPSHNPLHIIRYTRARLLNRSTPPLVPWVRGFKGQIRRSDKGGDEATYTTVGEAARTSKNSIEVSELPVGRWIDDYKTFLIKLVEAGQIRGYTENHTSDSVRFVLSGSAQQLDELEGLGAASDGMKDAASTGPRVMIKALTARGEGRPSTPFPPNPVLLESLRLESRLALTNMHAFDQEGRITKYSSVEELVDEHMKARMRQYSLRKGALLASLALEEEIGRNKAAFIAAILDGRVGVGPGGGLGATSDVVATELTRLGFAPMRLIRARASAVHSAAASAAATSTGTAVRSSSSLPSAGSPGAAADSSSTSEDGFGYLLSLPIQSLTAERHASLQLQAANSRARLEAVAKATEKDMWLEDLDRLEKAVQGMGVFEE